MADEREFPTAVVASISTGVALCSFGDIHDAAEFLMGHPIWTHHFADKQLCDDMKKAVLAQLPGFPTDLPGVTKDNWREHLAALEAKFGKAVLITKGSGLTAMLPTDGIPDHLRDKTVILDTP